MCAPRGGDTVQWGSLNSLAGYNSRDLRRSLQPSLWLSMSVAVAEIPIIA